MPEPFLILSAFGEDPDTVGIALAKGIADSNSGINPDMVQLEYMRSSSADSVFGECTIKLGRYKADLHGITASTIEGGDNKYRSNIEEALHGVGFTDMVVLGATLAPPTETTEWSDGATTPPPDPAEHHQMWVHGELDFYCDGVAEAQLQATIEDAFISWMGMEPDALRVSVLDSTPGSRRLAEETRKRWLGVFEALMKPKDAVPLLISANGQGTESDAFIGEIETRLRVLGSPNPTVAKLTMPDSSELPARAGSCGTNFCTGNSKKRQFAPEEVCAWISCEEGADNCCDAFTPPNAKPEPRAPPEEARASSKVIGAIIAGCILLCCGVAGCTWLYFSIWPTTDAEALVNSRNKEYEHRDIEKPFDAQVHDIWENSHSLQMETPGVYLITQPAKVKRDIALDSEEIGILHVGTKVEAAEIDLAPDAARIRAFIVNPPGCPSGWISIRKSDDGFLWAVKDYEASQQQFLQPQNDTLATFAPSVPLQVGDEVTWNDHDNFVPWGTVGQIVWMQEGSAKVQFPNARKELETSNLTRVTNEDLERHLLDSLQGQWRIYDGPVLCPGVVEIGMGGYALYNGMHYPVQDLLIFQGVVARNDGWTVDMAASTTRHLQWCQEGQVAGQPGPCFEKVKPISEYQNGDQVEWTQEEDEVEVPEVPRGARGEVVAIMRDFCRIRFPGMVMDLPPSKMLPQGPEPPGTPLLHLSGAASAAIVNHQGSEMSTPQSQTAKDPLASVAPEEEHVATRKTADPSGDGNKGRPPPVITDLPPSLAPGAKVGGTPVVSGQLPVGGSVYSGTPRVSGPPGQETLYVGRPGAKEPLMYKQVSPAHTPTSPPSTNTPPVSPHAIQLQTGVPPSPGHHSRSSGLHSAKMSQMSPVREPTNPSTPSGSGGVPTPRGPWAVGGDFKAAAGPIGSSRSGMSGMSGMSGRGPAGPKFEKSHKPGETIVMPDAPPPTPPAALGRHIRGGTPPGGIADHTSPKSGSSGQDTPRSRGSQGSGARPRSPANSEMKEDTMLSSSRRTPGPGSPGTKRQFKV